MFGNLCVATGLSGGFNLAELGEAHELVGDVGQSATFHPASVCPKSRRRSDSSSGRHTT